MKDWDESVYAWRALVAYEKGGGYWLDQYPYTWRGYYSAAFPPLVLWVSAGMFHLLGPTEFAHRLFGVGCGVAGMFGLYVLMRAVQSRLAGFMAAFALPTIFFWVKSARRGELDIPFTCFTIWALAFYALAMFQAHGDERRQDRLLIISGLFIGLGMMCKILITGILVGGTAFLFSLYLLGSGQRPFVRLMRDAALMILPALAVVAPWHIAMTFSGGWEFWSWYVGFHLIQRSSMVLDIHDKPWWFYLELMRSEFPFATWLALQGGLVLLLAQFARGGASSPCQALPQASPLCRSRARSLFLLIMGLFPLILYMTARTRRDAYFVPIMPGMAALAGAFMAWIVETPLTNLQASLVLGLMSFSEFWKLARVARRGLSDTLEQSPLLLLESPGRELVLLFLIPMFVGCLLLSGLGVAAATRWRRLRPYVSPLVVAMVLTMFFQQTFSDGIKAIYDPLRGRRLFGWQKVRPLIHAKAHEGVVFWSAYTEPARTFYLHGIDELSLFEPPGRMTVDPVKFRQYVAALDNPAVVVQTNDTLGPLSAIEGDLANLSLVAESYHLRVYARPGSAFEAAATRLVR